MMTTDQEILSYEKRLTEADLTKVRAHRDSWHLSDEQYLAALETATGHIPPTPEDRAAMKLEPLGIVSPEWLGCPNCGNTEIPYEDGEEVYTCDACGSTFHFDDATEVT